MSRRDGGLDSLALLILLCIFGGFLIPIAGGVSQDAGPGGRIFITLLGLSLIALAIIAWCLTWPVWLAVVLTVFGSLSLVGFILSALF